jgi:hypothetical protein
MFKEVFERSGTAGRPDMLRLISLPAKLFEILLNECHF